MLTGEPVFSVIFDFDHLWAEARGEAVRGKAELQVLRGRVFTGSWTVGRALEPGTALPFMKTRAQCLSLTIPPRRILGKGKTLDIVSYFHT